MDAREDPRRIAALLVGVAAVACAAPGPLLAAEGLYARIGAGFERSRAARFLDRDCSSAAPPALYGCGPGSDGAPLSSVGDFGGIAGFEIALGYRLAAALRVEAALGGRPAFSFSGTSNFLRVTEDQPVSADLSALTGLVSARLDLGETGVPRLGPFSPFVSLGAGASRIGIGETRMEFPGIGPNAVTIVPAGARISAAWMAAGGVAATLTERVDLDLAWRYSHLGRVATARGEASIVRPARTLDLEIAATEGAIAVHGLEVSLRYRF